jgi:hypothetical protein
MASIISKERFDDVAPENPDGTVDYTYRGYNYVIAVGEQNFLVRIYDTESDVATVIDPTRARTRAEARELVDFITSTLGCTAIQFYCGPMGVYCPVDIRTLEFIEI